MTYDELQTIMGQLVTEYGFLPTLEALRQVAHEKGERGSAGYPYRVLRSRLDLAVDYAKGADL